MALLDYVNNFLDWSGVSSAWNNYLSPGAIATNMFGNQQLFPEQNEEYRDTLDALLETMNKTSSVSAYDAALTAARETNSFNAKQAELNRRFQQTSAERQMQFESQQAQKAMNFSREMSNTTYQRAVQDLKAAGLSPLLAYQNLQTSSPSGVSASGSAAGGSFASGVKADTSSALEVERKSIDRLFSLLQLNINSSLSLSKLFFAEMPSALGSILGSAKR